jgi:hypothetical protein
MGRARYRDIAKKAALNKSKQGKQRIESENRAQAQLDG